VALRSLLTEGLFIEISEKMERLNAHVGSIDGTFQEAPEVFQSIRVNVAIDVLFRMVNNLVSVFGFQTIVGPERIGVDFHSDRNLLADATLKFAFLSRAHHRRADLPGPEFKQSKQPLCPSARVPQMFSMRLPTCMCRAFPPMKVSSASTVPVILLMLPPRASRNESCAA
jgi:hypothetical protein